MLEENAIRMVVSTDCVIFGYDGKMLNVLLIERDTAPYMGLWELPGGLLGEHESAEQAVRRRLREGTGVSDSFLEQFHTFTRVNRDPRERVLSVAFFALVRKGDYEQISEEEWQRAEWFSIDALPPLAFDHGEIIRMARERLRERLATKPVAFRLLDEKFKMSELQTLYELINGKEYERRNFAKKMLATGFLEDEGPNPVAERSRPATLYSFKAEEYKSEHEERYVWKKYPFDFW